MKTFVLGGSLNPARYSNKAIQILRSKEYEVVSFGLKNGYVADVEIDTELVNYDNIDTITLYLNPQRQQAYYDYIIGLNPRRIIYNPGTENAELEKIASEQGIENIRACTLVMLSTGQY